MGREALSHSKLKALEGLKGPFGLNSLGKALNVTGQSPEKNET